VPVLKTAIALVTVSAMLATPLAAEADPAYLGFNEDGWTNGSPTAAQTAELTRAALGPGAVVRFNLSWRSVATEGWGAYDRIYAALGDRGLRALPVLTDAPRWAAGLLCLTSPCPPDRTYYGAWGHFAASIAQRYPGSVALEVWNEPNKRGYWSTLLGPDPRQYAEVFRAAADAVHATAPSMPVLIGGLAPVGSDEPLGDTRSPTFLARFYDYAGSALWPGDGLAVHPYPNSDELSRAELDDPESDFSTYLKRLREVRDARDPAGSSRRLWATEIGYSLTGARAVSEAGQAQGVISAIDALSAMPDVSAVLVHRLADPSASLRLASAERGYGLLRSDLRPRRSYCDLAAHEQRPKPAGCP
jgi:hypothetical protein